MSQTASLYYVRVIEAPACDDRAVAGYTMECPKAAMALVNRIRAAGGKADAWGLQTAVANGWTEG